MKFELTYTLDLDDEEVEPAAVLASPDKYREGLDDVGSLYGGLRISVQGGNAAEDYSEGLVRLLHEWLQKVTWVLGGDTETLALRN